MNNSITSNAALPDEVFLKPNQVADQKKVSNDVVNRASEKSSAAEDRVVLEQSLSEAEEERTNASEEELTSALETVTSFVESTMKNVRFLNESTSGKTVIKVIDKETSEIISQFPSDKIIDMAERIKSLREEISSASGIFIDDNV